MGDIGPPRGSHLGPAGHPVNWKRGLEELRKNAAMRRQARETPTGGSAPSQQQRRKPTVEELVSLVRVAIEQKDWTSVVSPGPGMLPGPTGTQAAIKQLSENERFMVLQASAARYVAEPYNRFACGTWVQLLLENGANLVGRRDVREALRPLLATVSQCVTTRRCHESAVSCLGAWRLVVELAAAQREATDGAATAVEEASRMLHDAK